MKRVLFYSPHLSERGTETALYDFALYNELILGNKSYIAYLPQCKANNQSAIDKFSKKFEVFKLDEPNFDFGWNADICIPQLEQIMESVNCDFLFLQKIGKNDNFYSKKFKTIILVCSTFCEPHGHKYLYVSRWLSTIASNGQIPYIPIMIDLPSPNDSLRRIYSIPDKSFVFGRTGGMDTWNIPWARDAIRQSLVARSDLYFLFQNTPKFIEHDRVIYIPTTADKQYKSNFIHSCDAMIHARLEGESFGQSCAEFSTCNRPIVTYSLSRERSHIDYLGDKGIYYSCQDELYFILKNIQKSDIIDQDWNCYKDNSVENAMAYFSQCLET